MKRPIVSVLLVLGLTYIAVSCSSLGKDSKSEDQATTAQVSVSPITFEDVDQTVEVVGTLYGNEEATIRAKVAGRLLRNAVDIGDRVGSSALLAELDTTDYQLEVRQRETVLREASAKLGLAAPPDASFNIAAVPTVQRAKAQADNARKRFERAKKLYEEKPPLLSEQDFADIQTAHEVADRDYKVATLEAASQVAVIQTRAAELASARQRLADATITAPISASALEHPFAVAKRHLSPGEYVREGDPLFYLVSDDPLRFKAAIPERFFASLQQQQVVRLTVESNPAPVEGRVSRISPAVDPSSRSFEVEVTVPNPGFKIVAGAFARAQIIVGKTSAVPFVPKQAVVSFAGIDRIFSIEDGKAKQHEVQLGETRGDRVAVLQGFTAGTSVITDGANTLRDGQSVQSENL